MKLATHNSLSYVRPQWWARPFNFISKCQSLTVWQQYDLGVRYFDIRIWWSGNRLISKHGLAKYDVDVLSVLDFLNSKNDKVRVRLVLEDTFAFGKNYDSRFVAFVNEVVKKYENVTFLCGVKKSTWAKLVDLLDEPLEDFYEFFGDDGSEIYNPKWNAKHNNRLYWRLASLLSSTGSDSWLMFDFIEIGRPL